MGAETYTVVFEAQDRSAGTIQKFEGNITRAGGAAAAAAEKAGKGFSFMRQAAATAAGFLVAQALPKIISFFGDVVRRAQELGPIKSGFDSLTASIGSSAEAMLTKLRPATRNLISDFDLMQYANNAMLKGVARSDTEFASLAGGALRLGRAIGVDARRSIESLVTGIDRQSSKMLGTLGIVVRAEEAYETYARSVGKTASQLTEAERKAAFTSAAIKAVTDAVKKLGPEQETAADGIGRMQVSWDNFVTKVASSQEFQNFLRNFANTVQVILEILEVLVGGLTTAWNAMSRFIEEASAKFGALYVELENVLKGKGFDPVRLARMWFVNLEAVAQKYANVDLAGMVERGIKRLTNATEVGAAKVKKETKEISTALRDLYAGVETLQKKFKVDAGDFLGQNWGAPQIIVLRAYRDEIIKLRETFLRLGLDVPPALDKLYHELYDKILQPEEVKKFTEEVIKARAALLNLLKTPVQPAGKDFWDNAMKKAAAEMGERDVIEPFADVFKNAFVEGFRGALRSIGDVWRAFVIGMGEALGAMLTRAFYGTLDQKTGKWSGGMLSGISWLNEKSFGGKMMQAFLPAVSQWLMGGLGQGGLRGGVAGSLAGFQMGSHFGPWGMAIGAIGGFIAGLFGGGKPKETLEQAAHKAGKSAAQVFGVAYIDEMDQWIAQAAQLMASKLGGDPQKYAQEAKWHPSVVGNMIEQMTTMTGADQDKLAKIFEHNVKAMLMLVMKYTETEAAHAMQLLFEQVIMKAFAAGEPLTDYMKGMIDWAARMGVDFSGVLDQITEAIEAQEQALKDAKNQLKEYRFQLFQGTINLFNLHKQMWELNRSIKETRLQLFAMADVAGKRGELARQVAEGALTQEEANRQFAEWQRTTMLRYTTRELRPGIPEWMFGQQKPPDWATVERNYMGMAAYQRIMQDIGNLPTTPKGVVRWQDAMGIVKGVNPEAQQMVLQLIESINQKALLNAQIDQQKAANQLLRTMKDFQKRKIADIAADLAKMVRWADDVKPYLMEKSTGGSGGKPGYKPGDPEDPNYPKGALPAGGAGGKTLQLTINNQTTLDGKVLHENQKRYLLGDRDFLAGLDSAGKRDRGASQRRARG